MNLLKIGMLNAPQSRWEDALEYFDNIFILQFRTIEEPVKNVRFTYLYFPNDGGINEFLIRAIRHFSRNEKQKIFTKFCFFVLGIFNWRFIAKVKHLHYDYVHSSYNDFDDSAILSILLGKYLNKDVPFVRAFKETRPGYNYLEKASFKMADTIVLNCKENKMFFQKKYGESIFNGRDILIGLDEDCRSKKVIENINFREKLSNIDGKKHLVILAGRVFSDSTNERSGSRLYYLPKIKEFVEAGFIVHLHTKLIIPDIYGVDKYHEYQEEHPGLFYVEEPLDLNHDINAYTILSRYDYGVLHNFIEGTSNSIFDKVNIPNRYYEYQIANVIPIVKKGETIVMERIFRKEKTGVIYTNVDELNQEYDINFKSDSFKSYIERIYIR